MRVALVIPADPPGKNNFNQVPIGALYTATTLREAGMEVLFADLRRTDADQPSVARLADADLVVVFSTDYDLAQCYPSLRPAADEVARLRAAGARKIVCCGSHGTVDPELTRQFTHVDGVVCGEFEFAVPGLVEHVRSTGSVPPVWPLDGQAVAATEDQLAGLGAPAYELAPMVEYASEGFVDGELNMVRSALLLANRGCPFACNFCYLLFGRRLRRRPVESTIQEMLRLRHDFDVRHYFFLDYTFTVDKKWVQRLCAEIQRHRLDVSWMCQTRVDCIDPEVLATMKAAGCAGVWLGVESPELEQRRYLSKDKIAFSDIDAAVRMIREAGLEVLSFVMVGLPNETEDSLRSLNDWLTESEVYYSLSTFQRRPGTPLARDSGLELDSWDALDRPSGVLGESTLRLRDLGWFFEYHDRSPHRVSNVMRKAVRL
jgi:radical SAM superfamily enzyme YgiQ (UPF0313 family)